MSQSSTLSLGMDVPKESMAVAYGSNDHDAAVVYLGTLGTRPCASDQLVRQRPSTAKPVVCVYEAGPCGSRLSRDLTNNGEACWVVAPALLPKQAGDRVHTDRRDAVPLARLLRSGALTPVSVPTGEDEAMRALSRAREDLSGERNAAKCRRNAFRLRQASRYTGRATWGPAPLRGLSEGVCPTPAQQRGFQD